MNGDKILARYIAVMPHSIRTMTMETRDLEEINEYVQHLQREERKRAFAIFEQHMHIPYLSDLTQPFMRVVYKEVMGELDDTPNPDQLEFDFDGSGIS